MKKELDPFMVEFLLDHPMARSVVYGRMIDAATTQNDWKMEAWWKLVQRTWSERPLHDFKVEIKFNVDMFFEAVEWLRKNPPDVEACTKALAFPTMQWLIDLVESYK